MWQIQILTLSTAETRYLKIGTFVNFDCKIYL